MILWFVRICRIEKLQKQEERVQVQYCLRITMLSGEEEKEEEFGRKTKKTHFRTRYSSKTVFNLSKDDSERSCSMEEYLLVACCLAASWGVVVPIRVSASLLIIVVKQICKLVMVVLFYFCPILKIIINVMWWTKLWDFDFVRIYYEDIRFAENCLKNT